MIHLIIGWKDKAAKKHHGYHLILKIMVQTTIPKSNIRNCEALLNTIENKQ